jgi:hypothetical protein
MDGGLGLIGKKGKESNHGLGQAGVMICMYTTRVKYETARYDR